MSPRGRRGGRAATVTGGGRGRGGQVAHGGRGGDGGQLTQQTPEHITTIGVRRPALGSSGKKMMVITNTFNAEIPDGFIHHYDVISADKNPAALNFRLIKELQERIAPDIFGDSRAVFDGRKNLFAPVELNLGGDSREVRLPLRNFDVTLSESQENRPPKIYKANISYRVLHRFIRGQQSLDNDVTTAIMALNAVIRMEPSQNYPIDGRITRSFFTSEGMKNIGCGLVLWRGYFQSIRPAINRMLINVDISTGMMYQAGPLIGLCRAFLGINNTSALSSQLDDGKKRALSQFISGISVETQDAGSEVRRVRVVRKLSTEGANNITFTLRDGRIRTVARYYEETSGRPLKFPSMLCVEVGQGALIPIELCTVLPGQLFKSEVPDDKLKSLRADSVKFATKHPKERLDLIRKGSGIFKYQQSDYVLKFGVTVDQDFLSTEARVLPAPKLNYGAGGKASTVCHNRAEKVFFKPATIEAWVLVIFESTTRFKDENAQEVATSLVKGCRKTGMTVRNANPIIRRINGQSNISKELQAAGAACVEKNKVKSPSLFVVILPEGGNHLYTIVKQYVALQLGRYRGFSAAAFFYPSHYIISQKGVPTQCLKSPKCIGANFQFWANVALKINVKLDGINVITDPIQNAILGDPKNPTVVMGADVMHPPPRSIGIPSFAAVVSSVDQNAAKYIADLRVQASRQEIIADLKEMTSYALAKYMLYRERVEKIPAANKAPKRLIFYRDGVSDGEFKQVLERELPLIQAACQELKISPTITLIIVGKRHHVRLFPANDRDADRSGNCPAGTVVDRDIGHPTEFDFYLQSHAGILGTSRPAHYSVGFRSLDLYNADTVCARAKIHYDPSSRYEDSSDSGPTEATDPLEAFKKDYRPLNAKQSTLMYFS
ncbi:argonaute-like protein [Mycena crocata]|nr:argonaute-like protein [Mycena crocata]